MKNRLRPMGVGAILDNTFTILRERFWAFQGVNTLSMLPAVIVYGIMFTIVITSGLFQQMNDITDILSRNMTSLIFVAILLIIYMVVAFIGSIYMTYGNIILFSTGLHNYKIPFKEVFKGIKGKRWSFIGIMMLMALVVFLLMIPAVIVTALNMVAGIILIILLLFGFLLLVFYFSLTPVVLFLENKGVFASLKRAFQLMAKYRWRVFWISFVMILLQMSMFWGFYILAILAFVLIALNHIIAYIFAALFIILAVLAWNILSSFYYGPQTAVYYDLLIRKEGYDIQQQLAEETNSNSLPANDERSLDL